MKTIRRLYFYVVAFISVEVVAWGLIGLLRSIVNKTVSGGAEALAQALALILVGVPIFLVHWLWAQKAAAGEEEEQEASLRAVYLYAILLATLIPVAQNVLSFIDRTLAQAAGLGAERAFSAFRYQTLADNLIAILMNLLLAAYFWNILRGEWTTLKNRENFAEVRRLYRYLWTLYGLLMTIFGAQQVLRFLIYIPGDVLGQMGRETAVNGAALLIVGAPVWVYSWRVIQDSLTDPAEMGSTLRLGILYLLSLGGAITVITTASMLVNILVTRLLGADWSAQYFVQQLGGPISVGVPLGMVWMYHSHWLNRHIEAVGDKVRQAGMKRLYYYILAFIGLAVLFTGVATLLSFIIDMTTSPFFSMSDAGRSTLAVAISSIVVGLPLWLMTWRPMQAEALAQGEMGDHARRSVLRKIYLYLALFAAILGGMASAVGLIYQLFRALLTGDVGSDFLNSLLNTFQVLFLFSVVFLYHLSTLRRDSASLADALAEKQSAFAALVVDAGDGAADAVRTALSKLGAKVQVTATTPDKKPDGEFQAVILSGSLAVNAPEWIRSFGGNRIIVQNEAQNLVWAEDAVQAAESLQRLAEGQEVQKKKTARSPWMVVVYVFAALFALQLLFILLAVGISLVTGF
ncbi:MAG: DUF5671 domain-containing protein [Chloroflexota bacterium]|nr:hypothetical protein [Chloroflexota bacterium]MBI5703235.1 hypothetical protein [Chloroflexota bacterium]